MKRLLHFVYGLSELKQPFVCHVILLCGRQCERQLDRRDIKCLIELLTSYRNCQRVGTSFCLLVRVIASYISFLVHVPTPVSSVREEQLFRFSYIQVNMAYEFKSSIWLLSPRTRVTYCVFLAAFPGENNQFLCYITEVSVFHRLRSVEQNDNCKYRSNKTGIVQGGA